MKDERILELATKTLDACICAGTSHSAAIIAGAIRTALLEQLREEPDEEMIEAGYAAWDAFGDDATMGPEELIAIYRAMQAVLARRLEG